MPSRSEVEREVRRLVDEEGLTEKKARALAPRRFQPWEDLPLGPDGKVLPHQSLEDALRE